MITDEQKRGEFEKAFNIYLAERALEEVEEILKVNLGKYHRKQLDVSVITSLLERVENEKSAELINENSVLQIKQEVFYHFILPEWWPDFKICLNSYRAQGSGMCYVSSTEKVCAPPEGYTYEYNDNENPPECEIDAGLFPSHDTDEWAKDTELCFSIGGNSCEFATEKKCQRVNTYLFTGLNKLMNREENCYVNFSIQNNNPNIPELFKQIELCLVSYSEGSLEEEKVDINCAPLNGWVSSIKFEFHDEDCCTVLIGIFYMFPGNEKIFSDIAAITTPRIETSQSNDNTGIIVGSVIPSGIFILAVCIISVICYRNGSKKSLKFLQDALTRRINEPSNQMVQSQTQDDTDVSHRSPPAAAPFPQTSSERFEIEEQSYENVHEKFTSKKVSFPVDQLPAVMNHLRQQQQQQQEMLPSSNQTNFCGYQNRLPPLPGARSSDQNRPLIRPFQTKLTSD